MCYSSLNFQPSCSDWAVHTHAHTHQICLWQIYRYKLSVILCMELNAARKRIHDEKWKKNVLTTNTQATLKLEAFRAPNLIHMRKKMQIFFSSFTFSFVHLFVIGFYYIIESFFFNYDYYDFSRSVGRSLARSATVKIDLFSFYRYICSIGNLMWYLWCVIARSLFDICACVCLSLCVCYFWSIKSATYRYNLCGTRATAASNRWLL